MSSDDDLSDGHTWPRPPTSPEQPSIPRTVTERRRIRSNPLGVPILPLPAERPSMRMIAVAAPPADAEDSDGHPGPLTGEQTLLGAQIEFHLRRRDRRLLKLLIPIALAAVTALVGVLKSVMDDRDREGARRTKLEYLERDLKNVTDELKDLRKRFEEREEWQGGRVPWRFAPSAPAPPQAPAPKGDQK